MSDRIDEMFAPNPDKPWLMKHEGDIEDGGIKVWPYQVPDDHKTKKPPKDPWGKHALQLCECGHFGGDHRPSCIVDGCDCKKMKKTGEWEKRKLPKFTPEKGFHYVWTEWST